MELSAGDRLGPYEILAPLGVGGMGEVYRARDPRLGREVAVKVLPRAAESDPVRTQRFDREARAVAALVHPNVLRIYDVGRAGGLRYLVTELLHGGDPEPKPGRQARLLTGAVEGSNVIGVIEMTNMVETARSYQSTARLMDGEHERQLRAIQNLVTQAQA